MSDSESERAGRPAAIYCFVAAPNCIVGTLLGLEGVLFLSDWFRWSPVPKGWSVLVAGVAVVATAVLALLRMAHAVLCRRRFQFSIGSLLLFTAAVAIALGWLANEMCAAAKQRETLREMGELGYGAYSYADGELAWSAYWPRCALGDDFFLPVRYVFLGGPKVTDSVVADLGALRDIQRLSIESAQITDAALEHLKGFRQLRELYIGHCAVGDQAMEHLRNLQELRELHLNSTRVSDAGLDHIEALRALRVLRLHGTGFSDARVDALRRALPNCRVERY